MQLLTKMNTKMDQGYKLTNFYCTYCKGVTLTNPTHNTGAVYCPKCDKQYKPSHQELQLQLQPNEQHHNTNSNKNQNENRNKVGANQGMKDTMKIGAVGASNKYGQSTSSNTNKEQMSKQEQKTQKHKQSNSSSSKNNKHNDSKFQQLNDTDKQQQEQQQEDDQVERQYKEFLQTYNSLSKTAEQQKSEQTSKKIGNKLINGWAMLQQSCSDCNVPLMKSRQGNLVCCGCDRDFAVKNDQKQHKEQGSKKTGSSQKEKTDSSAAYGSSNSQPKQSMEEPATTRQNQKPLPTSSIPTQPNSTCSEASRVQIWGRISGMASRSLNFLQLKLEQAIQMNDMEAVDRVIRSIKNVKQLIS